MTFLINWWLEEAPNGLRRLEAVAAPAPSYVLRPALSSAPQLVASELPSICATAAGALVDVHDLAAVPLLRSSPLPSSLTSPSSSMATTAVVAASGCESTAVPRESLSATCIQHEGWELYQAADRRVLLVRSPHVGSDPAAAAGNGPGSASSSTPVGSSGDSDSDSRVEYYDRMLSDPKLSLSQRQQLEKMREKRLARVTQLRETQKSPLTSAVPLYASSPEFKPEPAHVEQHFLAYGDSLTAGYHSNGSAFAPYGEALEASLPSGCFVESCGASGLKVR
eukprot:COSAG05_NODE_1446_length_4868_cov_3.167121_1_plen_280_part_00